MIINNRMNRVKNSIIWTYYLTIDQKYGVLFSSKFEKSQKAMLSYLEISLSFVFLSEKHYESFHSFELCLITLTVFTCSSLPRSKRM